MLENDIYSAWSMNRIHSEWSVIASQEYRLHNIEFRNEAFRFATNMMRKARIELERIATTLINDGYRFVDPGWPINEPDPEVTTWVSDLRHRKIHLPLVLEAWMAVVGSVNFMGSHPQWSKPGYLFGDPSPNVDVLRTDPFVCALNREYVEYLYEEWQSEEPNLRMPFRVDFSPDYLHKANLSGGLPYQMQASSPSIDSVVFNERGCTSFVGLVRTALQWRGFPGFQYIANEGIWSTKGPQLM